MILLWPLPKQVIVVSVKQWCFLCYPNKEEAWGQKKEAILFLVRRTPGYDDDVVVVGCMVLPLANKEENGRQATLNFSVLLFKQRKKPTRLKSDIYWTPSPTREGAPRVHHGCSKQCSTPHNIDEFHNWDPKDNLSFERWTGRRRRLMQWLHRRLKSKEGQKPSHPR